MSVTDLSATVIDDHGRCESLATKIILMVDGFQRATKNADVILIVMGS
jgi:hypothetical protein